MNVKRSLDRTPFWLHWNKAHVILTLQVSTKTVACLECPSGPRRQARRPPRYFLSEVSEPAGKKNCRAFARQQTFLQGAGRRPYYSQWRTGKPSLSTPLRSTFSRAPG